MANAVVDRAQAVELQLDPVHVVVADVLVESGLQRVEAGELREVEELRFQGSEEALHRRVVKAVSPSRHALRDGPRIEESTVCFHPVLPPLVRVQDRLVAWPEA